MTKFSWQSVRWPDGSTYEGIVKDDEVCHTRGVFKYANGDRYEGEFQNNSMDGFGVYVWRDGTIYRGQWQNSMMHGCGVKISKQPNGSFLAEEGQFVDDEWVGNVMACTVDQARAAAAESDIAAQMARVFQVPDMEIAGSSRAAAPAAEMQPQSSCPAGASLAYTGNLKLQQQKQQQGPHPVQKHQGAGGQGPAVAGSGGTQVPRGRGGPLGFLAGLLGRR